MSISTIFIVKILGWQDCRASFFSNFDKFLQFLQFFQIIWIKKTFFNFLVTFLKRRRVPIGTSLRHPIRKNCNQHPPKFCPTIFQTSCPDLTPKSTYLAALSFATCQAINYNPLTNVRKKSDL